MIYSGRLQQINDSHRSENQREYLLSHYKNSYQARIQYYEAFLRYQISQISDAYFSEAVLCTLSTSSTTVLIVLPMFILFNLIKNKKLKKKMTKLNVGHVDKRAMFVDIHILTWTDTFA